MEKNSEPKAVTFLQAISIAITIIAMTITWGAGTTVRQAKLETKHELEISSLKEKDMYLESKLTEYESVQKEILNTLKEIDKKLDVHIAQTR